MIYISTLLILFSTFAHASCSVGDTKPVFLKSTKSGLTLKVCGIKDDEPSPFLKKAHLTYFLVTASPLPEAKATVFKCESELDHFFVSETADGLRLEELIWISGKWTPLVNRDIACEKAGCSISKPQCAFHAPGKINLDVIRKAKRLLAHGKPGDIDEGLITSLRDAALFGSNEAFKILKNPKLEKLLDGAVGEEYTGSMHKIELARESGCPVAGS